LAHFTQLANPGRADAIALCGGAAGGGFFVEKKKGGFEGYTIIEKMIIDLKKGLLRIKEVSR
jgi:hypothetical protein